MRISDWSSDVCSSDLPVTVSSATPYGALIAGSPLEQADAAIILLHGRGQPAQTMLDLARQIDLPTIAWVAPQAPAGAWYRSEEHTSELQSLMRISYAVFCLKKKNTNTTLPLHHTHYHH